MAVDDLSIVVGGQHITGWTRVRVTRGIERCPSDFQIELTEYYPGDDTTVTVLPGSACQVFLGSDLVLTGYVDDYIPKIDSGSHSIEISGRSKCEDLVDCSAEYPSSQIGGTTAIDLISKLAAPYGITVKQLTGPTTNLPQFNLLFGETAVEVIERIARGAGLLFYDDVDGNLLLSQVSAARAASGFTQGVNIKSAQSKFSMGQRYSDYQVVLQSLFVLGDLGNGGNLKYDETDPYVPRHRQKIIVAETGDNGLTVAKSRAIWEAKRRFGKSYQVQLVTDSWRDSAGKLWTPNTLVPVSIPAIKMPAGTDALVISEVTFTRDDKSGTEASLVLYPATAFNIEPILLQPIPFRELGFNQALPSQTNNFPLPAGNGQ